MTKNIHLKKISSHFILGIAVIAMSILAVGSPSIASAETINRELQVGSSGSDVSTLQTFLAQDKTLYPQGLVTGYYGFLTKAAVSNFQARNGIATIGRVGPITLPILNLQIGNGINTSGDVYAPIFTGTNMSIGSTVATVSWTTRESSRGKVYYSIYPIRLTNTFDQTGVPSVEPIVTGILAPYDAVERTYQTVTISGLSPNTTYFYLIEALDASNNTSITLPASFHTNQ